MLKNKPPLSIWVASVFILLCSVALIIFSLEMIAASFGSNQSPNTAMLSQDVKNNIAGLAILIIAAAIMMIASVYNLLRNGKRDLLLVLLGIPLVVGSIGQTIDLIGTASARDNMIGFGILAMFALPVVLLLLPSSRIRSSSVKIKK